MDKPKFDPLHKTLVVASNTAPVHIIFIGQCIRRKGIDLLLYALSDLRNDTWKLSIIGDGTEKSTFEALSNKLGLERQVCFTGALKNEEAMAILTNGDLLVLPSHWDGWGGVVNEALMRGIPVICSDHCGAVDLLANPWRGEIFPAGSIPDLRDLLRRQITRGKLTSERKAKIQEWASNVEGDSAMGYLLQVIESTSDRKIKPVPPWFNLN